MRKGILITRGAILESAPDSSWSIAVPLEVSVAEVVGLMSAFGLYCEWADGSTELRLFPIDQRARPTAQAIAQFYERGELGARGQLRWWGVDLAAPGQESTHVGG